MTLRWDLLVALRNSPIMVIALPASIIVPFLAAAFGYLHKQHCDNVACEVIRSTLQEQYAPLWFWYYIASVAFSAFALLVEASAPQLIKRHIDVITYMDEVVRSLERAKTSFGTEQSWSSVIVGTELARYRETWNSANVVRPVRRMLSSILFFLGSFIVLFGTFIYVPARVLSYDSLWRLFKSFFLLGTA